VEALQVEELDGNLKLTTPEGKIVVWGGDLLVCKFPRFDEAKESQDPAGVQTTIEAMEKLIDNLNNTKTNAELLLSGLK